MSTHFTSPARGSDRAPAPEHALVEDVMHRGIITCDPESDLPTVARTMVDGRIHAVVVRGVEPRGWGIVSALDLVAAMLPGTGYPDAGELASTELLTIGARERLERAAQVMTEHQLSHLLVVEGGEPV